MGIPDIQMLTNFARKYIPNVTVKWETMKDYGLADTEKKTISLSRNIPLNSQKWTIPDLGPMEYDKDSEIVRSIVISYLSEKGYLNKGVERNE